MLALLAAVAASPPPTRLERDWLACVDAHTTNPDWKQCGVAYVAAADTALNLAWPKVIAHARGQTRSDLVKEERAWVAFKVAACVFTRTATGAVKARCCTSSAAAAG